MARSTRRPLSLLQSSIVRVSSHPRRNQLRNISSSPWRCRDQQRRQDYGPSFRQRLRRALRDTKIEWRPIPVVLGIGFLGLLQFYRVRNREEHNRDQQSRANDGRGDGTESDGGPYKRRPRIRPSGSWFVAVGSISACVGATDGTLTYQLRQGRFRPCPSYP